MKEKDVINKTNNLNTVSTMVEDFKALGINKDDIVLVHSSLSNLGWVCGGSQAVILALMEVLGEEGTLVMPAQSSDWSDPSDWECPPVPKEWIETIYDNMPAYEVDVTPTRGMGRIAELFRTFPNTKRSNHPQVSFCANGKLAQHIIEKHPLAPQLGMDSPLGKLYDLDGKILLLGVGYDSCTSFHLAETLIDEMPIVKMGTSIIEDGVRVWTWFEDYDYDSDDFEALGKAFEEKHIVKEGKVGNATCKVFSVKEGVDFAREWLIKNRFSK